ncbi:MAG: glycosyltransferase family 2 protein [Hylemonella sp.]|nr:glycosyltransferase family 2 protein [Hylemonella sp.]
MTYKLSICIPTLNRAEYIGETLDSIVSQLTDEVEVVIVDGGSTDGTEGIVSNYQRRYPQIRYVRKDPNDVGPSNRGFDMDCHRTVELAQGNYCWLMTDDDLLVPGAIQRVMRELVSGYALVVVAVEIRDKTLTRVLNPRRPDLESDLRFDRSSWETFVSTVGSHLTFVGAVIVEREFWLERVQEKYLGTGFVHVGVIFDKPIEADLLVVAQPQVILRLGNAQWSSRTFQIWMFGWPDLVWSFSGISDEAKEKITARNPWSSLGILLLQRALGTYSIREYQTLLRQRFTSRARRVAAWMIAMLPRFLLFPLAWAYAMTRPAERAMRLFELRQSWRWK